MTTVITCRRARRRCSRRTPRGSDEEGTMRRRRFLQLAAMAGLGAVARPADLFAQQRFLAPLKVANPFDAYPNRDWERLYRDIFRHDRTFTFLCAPNDTHNCLLRGFVKNNILVRIEPTYGYGKATDLSGNRASHRSEERRVGKEGRSER